MSNFRSAFLAFCILALVNLSAQTPNEGQILPGESVAGVKLGDDFSSFESIFPKHPIYDEDYKSQLQDGCPERSYHWLDIDRDATGVFAYFVDGKIHQLSSKTPRFSLPNGIRSGSSRKQVERAYPRGRVFALLHSGAKVNGRQDLEYWVDGDDGVAFELYWNQTKGLRLVNGIDIFPKGTKFFPEGCISPPQEWKAMK